ncbi:MAG: DUF2339 domain-containing protein, partial [Paludibacteraceae bacterium]|nr:DUF2339 domain-containing protein [Paludibacteraceae bacterium]
MNKDQKIYELQQKIELLETQKQSLQEQLNKVGYEFHDFKSKYTYVMSEMSTQLSFLSESVNSLRNELTILTTAETEPQPVVTDPVYETCSTGIEKSTVVSDSVESTVKPEQVETELVQKAVQTEPEQESVQTEPVQEAVQTEPVQETVEAEPVQETVEADPVQEAVQTEPVQEAVETEYTQKTAATETAQRNTSAESRQSAPSKPQEETIFDKLRDNFDWEKFIGENLIMKLGILIVLIGVAIGGKYALEHQLLSPTMRIIIGTLFGAALQGVAIKLKKEYKKLSAVLASGAMATLYFMTYFAYDFYGLIPMPVAFVLMTLITVATVWQACTYDMEVIAIIGLVAAYVIPFMLSTGEGSPWALFSYISIINAGVMFISVKRYWRILFVSAYVSSWFIYGVVYRTLDFPETSDAVKLLVFLFINFVIFYVTFLAYKVKHKMIFQNFDIIYLLSNSFMFFGLGYNVMFNNETLAPYVAWFSFTNALIHGIVAFILIKKNMVDKSVYRLITGLAISFVTIAIMVWATGHWLTMFWMLEGTVLFTVSRISKRPFYEKMSYPVFFLALISLIIDWGNPNGGHLRMLTPLFEAFASYRSMWDTTTAAVQGNALSIINTVVFIMLCIFIGVIDNRYPMVEDEETQNSWMNLANKCLRVMAVFVVTTAILVHIERPWLTMFWMLEATILFTFARVRKNVFFEKSAYPVFVLAVISLLIDWGNPNAEHLDFMTFWFEESCPAGYGYALYVINTVVCMILAVCAAVLNYRYPLEETEETKNSFVTKASQYLSVMAIFVVTTAIFVHIEQPWMTVLWCAEASLLCYLGRTKSICLVERGAYVMVALSSLAFLNVWNDLPYPYDFESRIEKFENNFGIRISEIWTSVVAGLSLVATLVGQIWMINKFKLEKDGVAERFDLNFKLKLYLVAVLAFFIWTHTPWVITTALLFGLALLTLIFALRDDARLKKAFVAVFGLGIFCWLCDVFTAYESTFGDDGGLSTNTKQIIMLLGSVIDVTLIYMMRRYNEMPKFEASKISWFPFIALLVLMPFVAVGYVYCYHVGSWMEHQTLDNRVAIRLFTSFVFCFAMAYFSTWTFVSLKYKLNDFKKFTMTCLCLILFAKLFVGLFDLRIRGEEVDFNVIHLFSLVLTLFSAWTLYLYKKQEKCMFEMSEDMTTKAFDTFLFFGFVAVGGKELNKLCCLVGSPEAFGVAFSVFLGIVSLFGVYYGLYKDKKYLRIEGFVLLGFTLLKLFFYDMARFDQIYKVIALIS